MADDPISPPVRRLIIERIDSVPELEAILLLREGGDRDWTAAEAGERLYVSRIVAEHLLRRLAERGFFESAGERYRYRPESAELAATVDALARAYSRHLIAVTHLIHSKPSASVRQFADAFRLRKDK
jgi:hypothetical protein